MRESLLGSFTSFTAHSLRHHRLFAKSVQTVTVHSDYAHPESMRRHNRPLICLRSGWIAANCSDVSEGGNFAHMPELNRLHKTCVIGGNKWSGSVEAAGMLVGANTLQPLGDLYSTAVCRESPVNHQWHTAYPNLSCRIPLTKKKKKTHPLGHFNPKHN